VARCSTARRESRLQLRLHRFFDRIARDLFFTDILPDLD